MDIIARRIRKSYLRAVNIFPLCSPVASLAFLPHYTCVGVYHHNKKIKFYFTGSRLVYAWDKDEQRN